MFRRIREAACVAEPRGLLEGRCNRSERRGGFGDGVIDLIPDEHIVWIVGERCIQERFDTVEVEVIGSDRRIQSWQFAEEGSSTAGTEQTSGRKDLQCREEDKGDVLELCK